LSPGTYTYSASLGGAPTGTSTLRVERDGASTKIDETAQGSLDGMQMSATDALEIASDLAPTQYNGSYTAGPNTQAVTAALSSDSATVVGPGGQTQTIALPQDVKHFVVIEPGLVAGLFALPAQMQAWNDGTVLAIAPAYGRAEPLPASSQSPPRPAGVPATDVPLSFGGQLPFTIWYDPATFVPDQIVVPSQNVVVTRTR